MADAPIFFEGDSSGAAKSGQRTVSVPPGTTVIVQAPGGRWRIWAIRLLLLALGLSVLFNLGLFAAFADYMGTTEGPQERFVSGDISSSSKIAVIELSGVIMPPYTERWLKQIEKAQTDDKVKGVLLVIDSPGGAVADSHQIYHQLKKLTGEKQKPLFVQMKRLAASGGYYVAMGAGPQGQIFAEDTTWTGSIGVILPHYDVSELAGKVGVKSESLTTGEFKDSLSPFKPLSDNDRALWKDIINQSYEKFLAIIDDNRDTLNAEQVKALATGRIFTAKDALANGMIDQIGYQEDSLEALKKQLGLTSVRVVKYHHPAGLAELLTGSSQAKAFPQSWQSWLEASVPRAYYLASWLPPLP